MSADKSQVKETITRICSELLSLVLVLTKKGFTGGGDQTLTLANNELNVALEAMSRAVGLLSAAQKRGAGNGECADKTDEW